MAAARSEEAPAKQPWRENVEALLMAIVVALVLKYFMLEISKIPSGSMQPTLMGNAPTGIFDRVLVDKLSYTFREPERFEIVVFKHPLERSRNMVKRVVGMPGEDLRIRGGDVFVRPDGGDWQVLRRPRSIEQAMLRELDPAGWTPLGDPIRLGTGASVRYVTPGQDSIVDQYLDGYPSDLRARLAPLHPYPAREPVGDLRVEGAVQAEVGCKALVVEIREGDRTTSFRLPGPAARADAAPRVDVEGPGDPRGTAKSDSAPRLPASGAVDFAVQTVDDRLVIELDGEEVLAAETDPADPGPTSIRLRVEGGGVELRGLRGLRDVHYLPRRLGDEGVTIPPGHYFMMGDNTQDSADSREWEAITYALADGPAWRGNLRKWENPARAEVPGQGLTYFFRDEWGDRHELPAVELQEGPGEPAPFVPRELIHGRVFAVFWPLKPWSGIWRLGWTR